MTDPGDLVPAPTTAMEAEEVRAPVTTTAEKILNRLEEQHRAPRDELAALLGTDERDACAPFAAADRARAAAIGDEVQLRALIEFSNHCRRDCLYCGLRRGSRALSRYRMTPEEMLAAARGAAALGCRTVVLQSGEDPQYTADLLVGVVWEMKQECDLAITLSVGERPEGEYRLMREAGADRFLLRIETSSPELYSTLHPDSDWHRRLECIYSLRRSRPVPRWPAPKPTLPATIQHSWFTPLLRDAAGFGVWAAGSSRSPQPVVPWRSLLEQVIMLRRAHSGHNLLARHGPTILHAIQPQAVHLGRDIVGVHRSVAVTSEYLCDCFME